MQMNGTQFHEMTQEEFAQQPGTWHHSSPSGEPGSAGGSFHVGTYAAAAAVHDPRVDTYRTNTFGQKYFAGNPGIVSGRIVKPMTNTPYLHPSRNLTTDGKWGWSAEGVSKGAMEDWPRRSSDEPMSDVRANAVERGIRNSGRKMRKGIYYINAVEGDYHAPHYSAAVSAVLPNRSHFKTHEDYLVEAREAGKTIPKRALNGYTEIPGQGKLF